MSFSSRASRVLREADDELRFHVEMETEANRARGLDDEAARREALRELGGMAQTLEAVRDVRIGRLRAAGAAIWQDMRYSARLLRRSPGFAALAILVLALGIGVNTAAFSIVNAVFFTPPAVRAPGDLVYLFQILKSGATFVTTARDIEFFQGHYDQAFGGMTYHWSWGATLSADNQTEIVQGEVVAANYFDVLGVKPARGRTFLPAEDDVASTDLAVVISDDLWTRRFRRDPGIIGTQVRLDTKFFTIVGVMGPGFVGLSDPWRPSRYWVTSPQFRGADFRRYGVGVIARLKPGVSLAQARTIVAIESANIQRAQAEEYANLTAAWRPSPYVVLPISDVRMPFMPDAGVVPARLVSAVVIVVAIVLLIAAANIAGVLMARGVARAGELAVRQALGAGASRLVRQLLTESVLLSAAGGLAGLFVAWLAVSLYRAYTPAKFVVDVPLDFRILLFTAGVCLGAGLLVGLAPALQAARVDVTSALGGVSSGATRRSRTRLRHGIVIPQVALSIALLVIAGVHVRSLLHLELADLGYRTTDVVTLNVRAWDPVVEQHLRPNDAVSIEKQAERIRTVYRKVFDHIRDMPAVRGVALTDRLPVYGDDYPQTFISDDALHAGEPTPVTATNAMVSTGYFRTMGLSLSAGRDFDDRDLRTSPHVAIVSAGLARKLWPNANPIGQRFTPYSPAKPDQKPDWLEVVGVVNEVDPILEDLGRKPFVYTPASQAWRPDAFTVVAWTAGDPSSAIRRLQGEIAGADPFVEVWQVRTMPQVVGEILYPRRAAAGILAVSGVVGLLLACIGLYGVVSYSVAQRLREIGIRATLGAGRREILTLVLREGLAVAAIGAAPGFGVGLLALRVTSNLVGPVPTTDLVTFVAVPAVVAIVILAACLVPARRAARVDPMVVLRGL